VETFGNSLFCVVMNLFDLIFKAVLSGCAQMSGYTEPFGFGPTFPAKYPARPATRQTWRSLRT